VSPGDEPDSPGYPIFIRPVPVIIFKVPPYWGLGVVAVGDVFGDVVAAVVVGVVLAQATIDNNTIRISKRQMIADFSCKPFTCI
jgi:hypothetical protein